MEIDITRVPTPPPAEVIPVVQARPLFPSFGHLHEMDIDSLPSASPPSPPRSSNTLHFDLSDLDIHNPAPPSPPAPPPHHSHDRFSHLSAMDIHHLPSPSPPSPSSQRPTRHNFGDLSSMDINDLPPFSQAPLVPRSPAFSLGNLSCMDINSPPAPSHALLFFPPLVLSCADLSTMDINSPPALLHASPTPSSPVFIGNLSNMDVNLLPALSHAPPIPPPPALPFGDLSHMDITHTLAPDEDEDDEGSNQSHLSFPSACESRPASIREVQGMMSRLYRVAGELRHRDRRASMPGNPQRADADGMAKVERLLLEQRYLHDQIRDTVSHICQLEDVG
ncbi:hypothetical protein HYDPIDRAFT_26993 [Hydnomerulius pinastri MD-312]|nr:hypothetical protein HYDPIDRAFT_26993 [Hydnomerulius pinastri MD-312]